jgi:ActR/RegA family two-component response regulator
LLPGHATLEVANLSAGGALLVGQVAMALGERIALELFLPDGCVGVMGRVVRHEVRDGKAHVAVRFEDVPHDVERRIDQVVETENGAQRRMGAPSVLVLDDAQREAAPLCHAAKRLGYRPAWARTFLDGLRVLQAPRSVVTGIVVDYHVGNDSGLAMLAWCAEAYPAVRRVLTVQAEDLGPLNRHGAAPAHAVLCKPVLRADLARALETPGVRARVRAAAHASI